MLAAALFVQLVEIIVAATLVSALLRKLKQPNLFAYIVAGIIIGPLVLGGMNFSWLNLPFDIGIKEVTPEIQLLSELGAAFLLFSIGIETSVKRLLGTGKSLVVGTLLQVVGVIGVTVLLTKFTGLLSLQQALFVGTILAFSSTMIVIKLLADSKQTNTLNGRIMISILLIQDFLVILFVPLLENVSQITNPAFFLPIFAKSIALVIIALLANKYIFPKLFNIAAKENELFFLSSISTALLFISVSFILEIPITIGAFIGGLALNNLPYNTAIYSKIRALRDFFLTIFFVALGAELSFSFGSVNPALMALIILIIFLFKPIVFFLVGLLSGYGSRLGLELGFGLAQASEFGFIIAGLAFSAGVFSSELFSFIVTIVAFSMIVTPHLMNFSPKASNFVTLHLNRLFKIDEIKLLNSKIESMRNFPQKKKLINHVVIIGGGLIGRKLAKKLKINHQVLIVDSDPEVVMQGKKDNLPFVYGTSEDAELLEQLDLDDAKIVVIAMVNRKEAIAFIDAITKDFPKVGIFATAAHYYDALDFYERGVDFVSMPLFSGIDDLYKKIDFFKSKAHIFVDAKTKEAHLRFIKEQADEENKYKKKLIA